MSNLSGKDGVRLYPSAPVGFVTARGAWVEGKVAALDGSVVVIACDDGTRYTMTASEAARELRVAPVRRD